MTTAAGGLSLIPIRDLPLDSNRARPQGPCRLALNYVGLLATPCSIPHPHKIENPVSAPAIPI